MECPLLSGEGELLMPAVAAAHRQSKSRPSGLICAVADVMSHLASYFRPFLDFAFAAMTAVLKANCCLEGRTQSAINWFLRNCTQLVLHQYKFFLFLALRLHGLPSAASTSNFFFLQSFCFFACCRNSFSKHM